MSENSPETPQDEAEGHEETPESETFSKDYVEKLRREAAKYRTEARENAAAAKRLAEIEDAQKSAEQRAADKIADLERRLAEKDAEALRSRVQAKYGIDDDDAALFLTAQDEATLTKQAQRLAEARAKPTGIHVPGEGRNSRPAVGDADERAAARALFGRGG